MLKTSFLRSTSTICTAAGTISGFYICSTADLFHQTFLFERTANSSLFVFYHQSCLFCLVVCCYLNLRVVVFISELDWNDRLSTRWIWRYFFNIFVILVAFVRGIAGNVCILLCNQIERKRDSQSFVGIPSSTLLLHAWCCVVRQKCIHSLLLLGMECVSIFTSCLRMHALYLHVRIYQSYRLT